MEKKRIVIALGGNAIQSGDASAKAQIEALEVTAREIRKIIQKGHEVIITHGNGPQVGNLLLQQAAADSPKNPPMPLDTCGAMTQGMIGYWMQNRMDYELKSHGIEKNIATIVTQVVVDNGDPAFTSPTKPIGPFYTDKEVYKIMTENVGFIFKEDAGRGWRRVVPSPKPVSIKEHKVISQLVENGNVVISVGGGGIPVVESPDGELKGVEAVIDKDFAAQKLAELVNADMLLILTAVDHVFVNFNKPDQKALELTTIDEVQVYIDEGQFSKGSMLPKVEAAMNFVTSSSNKEAIITSLDHAVHAVDGKIGTKIVNELEPKKKHNVS